MQEDAERIDWEAIKERVARVQRVIDGNDAHGDREQLLARRAERYRKVEQQVITDTVEVVVFERAGVSYAAPLDSLEEIRAARNITPVPGVSSVIRGVINVRGQIVAIHDLCAFRGESCALADQPWAVIGHSGSSLIALAADSVQGVQRPTEDAIRPVPLSLGDKDGCFRGALEDGTVVLDFAGLSRSEDFFLA